jgi:5'-nucleotidase
MPDDAGPLLVLTNDDGVDAPGIQALRKAVGGLGRIRVIAPSGPLSGCGHRVTTHDPIQICQRADDCLAVSGTPVDCVRLAVHHLATDTDWFLSGINAGANLGTDVHHSGTVAAVREATIRGRPGIAISQYIARGWPIDWTCATTWATGVIQTLLAMPWEPGSFWNVNLPHLAPGSPQPETVFCPLDPSPLPLNYRVERDTALYAGDYHSRARQPAGDVTTCFGGNISVTLVRVHGGLAGSLPKGASDHSRSRSALG